MGGDFIFAQQVMGYGNPGDVWLALSTSGNAQNVVDALMVAKAKEMKIIGMTGETVDGKSRFWMNYFSGKIAKFEGISLS